MILIVDDDADVRSAIADVLTDEGFRVACAAEGGEAIDLMQIGPIPDLVLLDWMMPGMDGAGFLRAIANVPEFASIPLILFTAMNASQHPTGHRVLAKPLDLDELIWTVTEICPAVWSSVDEPGTDRSSIPPFGDDSHAPSAAGAANATGEKTVRELCAGCGQRAAGRCATCGRPFCKACLPRDSSRCERCQGVGPR